MRTETITRTIYTFDELPEDVKRKAIEKLSDINVDYNWWNCTCEGAKEVGIEITSFDLDCSRHACASIPNCQETAELILSNHGDCCETYKTAKAFLDEYKPLKTKFDKAVRIHDDYSYNYRSGNIYDLICDLENKIEDLEDDFKKSITEDYSIILQKEYEYLTSEDAIVETIKANEYEFDEQGNFA